MDVCSGFLSTSKAGVSMHKNTWEVEDEDVGKSRLTVAIDRLFGEAGEVDVFPVRIDIEKLDAGAEVIHELPQRSRGDSPVVRGLFAIEFGVDGHVDLEGQPVGRGDAIAKDKLGNEAALHAWTVLDGDLTSVYQALPFTIPLSVTSSTAAKYGDERLRDHVSIS